MAKHNTHMLAMQAVELQNTVSPRIAVMGDPGRIVQILNNLLGNAGKSSDIAWCGI